MPLYFFHTADGGYHHDETGTELPNLEMARRTAIMYAGELLKSHPELMRHPSDFRVHVVGEAGVILFEFKALRSMPRLQELKRSPRA